MSSGFADRSPASAGSEEALAASREGREVPAVRLQLSPAAGGTWALHEDKGWGKGLPRQNGGRKTEREAWKASRALMEEGKQPGRGVITPRAQHKAVWDLLSAPSRGVPLQSGVKASKLTASFLAVAPRGMRPGRNTSGWQPKGEPGRAPGLAANALQVPSQGRDTRRPCWTAGCRAQDDLWLLAAGMFQPEGFRPEK